MRIKKIFNQNTVLVQSENEEKIVVGKGIGFNKQRNDLVFPHEVERIFVAKESQSKLEQLLSQIPTEYFLASEEIIDYAENLLKTKLNEHIHIALADHIAFAVDRMQDGIVMQNKLLREIQILYPEEFNVAEWAIEYLHQKFSVLFTLDEAAYIAIHIHSARSGEIGTKKSVREITIISSIVDLIASELSVDFNKKSMRFNYSRLISHLRFVLDRVYQGKFHAMDVEVLHLVKRKYASSYSLAEKISKMVYSTYGQRIPEEELGYITLHIERLALQVIMDKQL